MTMNMSFYKWRQPKIVRQFSCLTAGFQQISTLHLWGLAGVMEKNIKEKGCCSVNWKGWQKNNPWVYEMRGQNGKLDLENFFDVFNYTEGNREVTSQMGPQEPKE